MFHRDTAPARFIMDATLVAAASSGPRTLNGNEGAPNGAPSFFL